MALKYTNEIKFNRFLQLDQAIPGFVSGSAPTKENVGTGNGSTTIFYFDQNNIIKGTPVIYTGSTAEASATTTLTIDTHYTIDYDNAKLTLTSAGVASVATNAIFATYSYNRAGIQNSFITEVLERAEEEVDDEVNTLFFDGSSTTPSAGIATNEIHEGQGRYNRVYRTEMYPIYFKVTTASGAISAGATTITVPSTNGFQSSGYLGINNDKVSYTGKTTTQFTGVTGVTTDVTSGDTITSFVVERALDDEGNEPSYTTMKYLQDYDIDFNSGEIKINNTSVAGTIVLDNFQPPIGVWNRVRFNYNYGYDEIPVDVERLVHLIASKEIYSGQVLNALTQGRNGFSSEGINQISEEIKRIKERYKAWRIKTLIPQTLY